MSQMVVLLVTLLAEERNVMMAVAKVTGSSSPFTWTVLVHQRLPVRLWRVREGDCSEAPVGVAQALMAAAQCGSHRRCVELWGSGPLSAVHQQQTALRTPSPS